MKISVCLIVLLLPWSLCAEEVRFTSPWRQWLENEEYGKIEKQVEELLRDPNHLVQDRSLDFYYSDLGKTYRPDLEKLNKWVEKSPHSHVPLAVRGYRHIRLAWEARGGGFSNTVTEDGWKGFHEYLKEAGKDLEKAHRMEPRDPWAPAKLITVAMGLGLKYDYMEKQFQAAIKAQPGYYEAYSNKHYFLMPKWGGNAQAMMEFSRQAAKEATQGNPLDNLVIISHVEMAKSAYRRAGKDQKAWRQYWKRADVWNEIYDIYKRWASWHSETMLDQEFLADYDPYNFDGWDSKYDTLRLHNRIAQRARNARRYDIAAREFDQIGHRWTVEAWKTEEKYRKARDWVSQWVKANVGENKNEVVVDDKGRQKEFFQYYSIKGKDDKIKDGIYMSSFTNGNVEIMGHYDTGRKEGKWTHFNPDQSKKMEGNYHYGHKVGTWISWLPDGTIGKEEHY